MFVGREHELGLLNDRYRSEKSELVVIYGRRRIGKSSLVERFLEEKPVSLRFEGIEGENTVEQIRHFTEDLRRQTGAPILESVTFRDWEHVFSFLTEWLLEKQRAGTKTILFFDELPWMAAGRSRLVSLLKYFWDNHWKSRSVMLVLCGSVTSFMVKKVLQSKALYGRITSQILLRGLTPRDASLLFRSRRSREEILKYLLVFGGVPKYLEEIRLDRSFAQNMNRLCFSEDSPLAREVDRIFYSQFRESRQYVRIVQTLRNGASTLKELGRQLQISSGGGLRQYVRNLEDAEIVRAFIPFGRGPRSKFRRYSLLDEYLHFYFRYVEPNRQTITESRSSKLFELLTSSSFDTWLGFAFERFCIKHSHRLAEIMGFAADVLIAAPYFERDDTGFQIDLLFQRADNVLTVCEIKHHDRPVTTKVIPELERKCGALPVPRGYTCEKALISVHGADKALLDSGYFHHHVTLSDIL